MKKIIFLLSLTIILTSIAKSQSVTNTVKQDSTYTKVDSAARFGDGEKALKRYLEKNLNIFKPVDNGAPNGTYNIIIDFVVTKNGNLDNIKAETKFGYGMEEEAIRVIKNSPSWIPAMSNGEKVNSFRKQPFTFRIGN